MVAFAGFAITACALRSIRAAKGVCDPKGRRWEPILGLASLKAELERREDLSDTRSELEPPLMAFRSLRPRNGLWIYFGEGVPIDATNHRGGSASRVATPTSSSIQS
jgi:hypothetical protein